MRTILLAGFVCLSTAASALAEPPLPPQAVPAVPGASAVVPCAVPIDSSPAAALLSDTGYASGPRVWASADYLLMWYTPMRTPPLIEAVPSGLVGSTAPGTSITIFPENNRVNFDAFSGIRGMVGVGLGRYGVEVGGFVLERKTENASLFTTGTPFAVAQGYISAGTGNPTSLFASLPGQYSGGVSASAESRLWGVEGNMRFAWYALFSNANDLLLGFRYLDLQESLTVDSPSTFPDGDQIIVRDSIRTRNAFYGGQLGFNGRLGGETGFGLDISTKGAVGGVAQHAELIGSNTFLFGGVNDTESGGLYARGANAGIFTRSKIAYLHDVDVKLTYNFTPSIQVSFGYSLIYLSSVMRPGNAIDPVINDSGVRFVAQPTPSPLHRPAFEWRAEELVVQGMTFGARVQY